MDPPFSKEEWGSVKFEEISEEGTPAGQRVLAYIQKYHDAVLKSGRTTELLDARLACLPESNPLTEGLLRKFLRRLLEQDDCTVRHVETMMAATSFARFVDKDESLPLGQKTQELVEKVEAATIVLFIACVNRHFRFIR